MQGGRILDNPVSMRIAIPRKTLTNGAYGVHECLTSEAHPAVLIKATISSSIASSSKLHQKIHVKANHSCVVEDEI